jgi:ABC-type nickel/cobalt efflux system permease component RcnA
LFKHSTKDLLDGTSVYEGEVCIRHPFFLLVGAAAAVALLHSILPDHWVPLAVIARTQRWRISHVIRVTFLASLGHVLTSLVLGGIIAFIGLQFQHEIDTQQGRIVGVVLILTGSFFLIWGVVGHGPHGHHHADDHDHQHEHPHTSKVTQEPSLVKRLSAIGLSIEKLCRTYLLCGYRASSLTLGLYAYDFYLTLF